MPRSRQPTPIQPAKFRAQTVLLEARQHAAFEEAMAERGIPFDVGIAALVKAYLDQHPHAPKRRG